MKRVVERIVRFIRDYVESANAEGVVVGISGGVDSATTAFLCVKALGKDRVLGLIMPEEGITREEDVRDALEVCKILGISYRIIDISPIVRSFLENLEDGTDLAKANVRPRVRMIINYFYANSLNYLVAGTGNKSEIMTGYFCYDEETRALTMEGLKTYKEIKPGDVVFSLNNGRIEKVRVRDVYTFHYYGEMVSIYGKRTNLLVTPNHRILTSDGYVQAIELLKKKYSLPALFKYICYTFPSRVSEFSYEGIVWCPDAPPYHNLLVEREGKFTFCGNTKYGDGGADFFPIGDLYKTEVWELARYLGVPERIVKKKPSSGLWIGQTDEGELGISYKELDEILRSLEKGSIGEGEEVRRVLSMVERSKHKREMPPIAEVRDLLEI